MNDDIPWDSDEDKLLFLDCFVFATSAVFAVNLPQFLLSAFPISAFV
ncbi:MAG: hypothetical protein WC708_19805 [Lentisphaeria bacterium]